MIGERLDHPLPLDREAERRPVEAEAPGRWSDGSAKLRGRLLSLLAALAGLALLCLAYIRVSYTFDVNSDNASIILQAESFARGNYLLKDWILSTVPFLAELPFYALGILLLGGVRPSLMYVVPAIFATLAVALAVWLAGRGMGRRSPVLGRVVTFLLIGLPSTVLASNCLRGPGHLFTMVLLLTALLTIDSPARFVVSPGRAILFAMLLGLAIYNDSLALYVLALPLAIVCLIRLLRQGRRESGVEVRLLGASLVAWALAKAASALIARAGGYFLPGTHAKPIPLEHVQDNIHLAIHSVLGLSGANFMDQPSGLGALLSLLHFPGLALILFSIGPVLASWRTRARNTDLVSQVLATGMLVNLAAYLACDMPYGLQTIARVLNVDRYLMGMGFDTSRYLIPFAVFGAILAGRVGLEHILQRVEGPDRQRELPAASRGASRRQRKRAATAGATSTPPSGARRRVAIAIAAVSVVYACSFAQRLCSPIQTPSRQALCDWLSVRGLRSGYSAFWNANIATVLSEGQLKIRTVRGTKYGMRPHGWLSYVGWYGHTPANFMVIDDFNTDSVTEKVAVNTFGRPSERHQVGDSLVLVWNKDITPRLCRKTRG